MRRSWRFGIVAIIGVAALAAAVAWGFGGGDAAGPKYRLAAVERGAIAATVSASGTLSAVVTVDVGSQVSGLIKTLSADFNSEVTAGQTIARIDPASFEAKVSQAGAELAVAKANVSMQRATLGELQADIGGYRAASAEAKAELGRKRALFKRRVVASSAVDKALALHAQAAAKVGAGRAKLAKQKAQIDHARAQVMEKEAVLKQRQLDLDHTFIRSPVDGVVINRNVDAGQTVAASLQAPVLFTIAQDLTRMQVEVSVDEADIGRIRVGQAVAFTVDSFPGRNFHGKVHQIRKAGKEVSNVVTYTVVVTADNADQRLLPGMTANVTVIVGRRRDVLKVANAALRFQPPSAAPPAPGARRGRGRGDPRARTERVVRRMSEQLTLTDAQKESVRGILNENGRKIGAMRQQGMGRSEIRERIIKLRTASRPRIEALLTEEQRRKFRERRAARDANPTTRGRVWVANGDGEPTPVDVVFGISDGTMSEIVRGGIEAGQQVIVGIAQPGATARRRRPRLGL